MTTIEFIEQFEKLTQRMIAQMRAKNNDYAGKRDPFKNLRRHGEYGIVVRLDDKLARLDSFFNPAEKVERQVKDETVEDTGIDAAVYCLLLVLLYRDNQAMKLRPLLPPMTFESPTIVKSNKDGGEIRRHVQGPCWCGEIHLLMEKLD